MTKQVQRKKKGPFQGNTYDVTMTTDSDVTPLPLGVKDELLDAELGAALGGTLSLITIVTISGNTALLVILLKTTALRTMTNSFIVSLAMSDLLTGIFVMPFCAAAIMTGSWPFISGYCEVTGFIHSVCSIATVLNIMMVSSDRVLAVAKPLKYSLWMTPTVAGIMIAYVWLQSIIFSAVPFCSFSHYTYGRAKGFCAFDWSSGSNFVLSYALVCLLMPALITFVFLLVIIKHAKSRPSLMSLMPVPVAAVSVVVHSQPMVNYRRSTIQAMRTLFIITVVVAVLWTPQITVNIFDIHKSPDVSESFRTSAMWLCLMSSMTNPLIFLSNRKFKEKFKEVFCRCLLKRSNIVGVDASVTQHTASTALPYTSHFEHSNVFSKATPSQANIPEEEVYRRVSFCEPQVRIGIKTELLLAVPNRCGKSGVPIAKVEPMLIPRKLSTEEIRRLSTETLRRSSDVRRPSDIIRRPSDIIRRSSDIRRPSEIRRGSDASRAAARAMSPTQLIQSYHMDIESSLTNESTSTTDGFPPVVLSVTPQLHAIPADMAEDINNDMI
ncbi:histamine H2 receptor-like [Lineus longissimus]|uniref:histamine H2 receptor-like n=1 Tax=Lineus longissimus TaxID=88925 RepID=UPI002B4D14E8